MSPLFAQFCEQVCLMIRWRAARGPVSDELAAHLEDHAAALEARGLDPETAARRAVEADAPERRPHPPKTTPADKSPSSALPWLS